MSRQPQHAWSFNQKRRFVAIECDNGDGTRGWDVWDRGARMGDPQRTVSTHTLRKDAKAAADAKEAEYLAERKAKYGY